VLPIRLLDFLSAEKKQDIGASIPEILRRARERGIIAQAECIDRSTVYRACRRLNIPVLRRRRGCLRDSRRFAYPHRMDLVLSDGKHFRAGATRARRVALFFLDDSSRFGLHVVVGPTESKELFLRGLYGSIQHSGIADIYYLDHGAGFVADDTTAVMQQLPALLIHGEKAYPEGHGKIERLHRTAVAAILRNLDGRADIDPDCGALELRLAHWLRETYNHTPHDSLENKTPWARFSIDEKALRFPENLTKLREKFLVQLRRKVSNDHVVSIDGVGFETPRGLAGSWIITYRQVLDGTVHVLHEGRLVKLHPVDLATNARTRRNERIPAEEVVAPLPKSAADLAFERDFSPITDASGNFKSSQLTINKESNDP
jgi:transposase InsO family protein